MKKLQLKPNLQAEVIPPHTVYLLGEKSAVAFTGELYCQLLPFLDGNYSFKDIVTHLETKFDFNTIYRTIERLKNKKYIVEYCDRQPRQVAAFWSELKIYPKKAFERLAKASVFITNYGDITGDILETTLKSLGVKVITDSTERPSLAIVLTDDYLRPELAEFNHQAIRNNIKWMLIKPVGIELWIGAIFEPGKTGCWQCLAQRLENNREILSTIQHQQQEPKFITTSQALLPSSLQIGLNLAATEIIKWLVKDRKQPDESLTTLEGKIITLNLTNLDLQTHILTKRPQCPVCGDLSRHIQPEPIVLNSRPKKYTIDGGHRILSPQQTLERWQHHISPITGVVSSLVRTSAPGTNHSYLAVHNFGQAKTLNQLRHNLSNKAAGKGKTQTQAKASGFCEAIERYSGLWQGDEIRKSKTYNELKDSAIYPTNYLQFSENQYRNRLILNQQYQGVDFIPEPFRPEKAIDWTPVWSLTAQSFKYISTALGYYHYPLSIDHFFGMADSNGNAAGNAIEEAILQGFMELVERDSVAIWWYNRLQRPRVDLESFQDPYIQELQTYYQQRGREFWVIDLTSDLGIPVFAAISRCQEKREFLIAGYGAHLDPKIALTRALTEMNQFLSRVELQYPNRLEGGLYQWLTHASLANQPYLAPDRHTTPKIYADYPQQWSDDLKQDVLTCVEIAKQQNLETLILDQTRPDIGLNVVKVIVPGLRHFLPRFAPGRLYDVPVKLGWLDTPLVEAQMNPIPMPF